MIAKGMTARMLAQRRQARPEHLALPLRDAGRLRWPAVPGGGQEDPGPAGFSGSVVIARAAPPQAQADADPYVAAGVYTRAGPPGKVLP